MKARMVPPIELAVGFRHKETEDIVELSELTAIPTSLYPPSIYTRLYEVATVKVFFNFNLKTLLLL